MSFWRNVYSKWGRSQVAIHDKVHMDIIYDVFELPGDSSDALTSGQKAYLQERFYDWKSRLNALEDKMAAGMPLDADEKELVQYVTQKAGHKNAIQGASERLRYQRGLKERFLRGLEISRRYDDQFRQVFRNAGLPEDLAYLPHVESSFQYNAHSSAGALGIWQFTAGAAKIFMDGDASAQARLDPMNSTRGAARYLATAYEKLGSWPLAITSYNHGIGGMQRARNIYGHDFMSIVKHYDHPQFGFASRNYYAEFLAAKDIASDPQRYFTEASDYEKFAGGSEFLASGDTPAPLPVREVQEVPQSLETVNPPPVEADVVPAIEPKPVEVQSIQTQSSSTEPVYLAQAIPAEPINQAKTVRVPPVPAEPIYQAESDDAESAELAEVESTEVVEAEPTITHRIKSHKTPILTPKKIEKASLPIAPKKLPLDAEASTHKKQAVAALPATAKNPALNPLSSASGKITVVSAPVNAKKSAKGLPPSNTSKSAKVAVAFALKPGAKQTTSNPPKHQGKVSTSSTKPTHPSTARFKQGIRPKPIPAREGEKKPGEKIRIAKR